MCKQKIIRKGENMDNKISFGTAFRVTVGSKGSHTETRNGICNTIIEGLKEYSPKIVENDGRNTVITTSVKPDELQKHLQELGALKQVLMTIPGDRFTKNVAINRLNSCIGSATQGEYHRRVSLEFPNARK